MSPPYTPLVPGRTPGLFTPAFHPIPTPHTPSSPVDNSFSRGHSRADVRKEAKWTRSEFASLELAKWCKKPIDDPVWPLGKPHPPPSSILPLLAILAAECRLVTALAPLPRIAGDNPPRHAWGSAG